jgi:pyridoxal phosphate enzyme (YggS family)
VRAVHALGQSEFGENYVQEASAKRSELADLPDLKWVLVGPLQSNKTALAADVFERIESIDRLKIAQRLADARDARRAPLEVLVQVNISGEATKSGVAPGDAVTLAESVAKLPRLAFRGFMGIAQPIEDRDRQRAQFAILRECAERARSLGLPAHVLSMGMTGDLEAAVAEGSTEVRVGTAIFGERG